MKIINLLLTLILVSTTIYAARAGFTKAKTLAERDPRIEVPIWQPAIKRTQVQGV